MEQRRQRKDNSGVLMHLILIVLFLFLAVSLIVKSCISAVPGSSAGNTPDDPINPGISSDPVDPDDPDDPDDPTDPDGPTEPDDPTDPTEPYVTSTASIGVTGDILLHGPVLRSVPRSGEYYDFKECFQYIKAYYESYDFMIANLEVSLGGSAAGEYKGYPIFNSPDSIIDTLQWAGVDMLLTANNHCYDTGHNGFIRTQEVLNEKGMLYNGTQLNESDPNYTVQNINGIKVGMVTYTYDTGRTDSGNMTLNGLLVRMEDTNLINHFDYSHMDQFYSEVESAISSMEAEGADVVMFFIHWGNEYQTTPSTTQQKIAQNLCNLGVDVIVGGHPHVVQPMDVLTSETGETTYCIYSTGNALSNQRRSQITSAPNGHTEDGMIFGVEFQRWSDGTVTISDIDVTPLWVSLDYSGNDSTYTIIPVDVDYSSDEALTVFAQDMNNALEEDLPESTIKSFFTSHTNSINGSYSRTMQILGTTLDECRQALGLDSTEDTTDTEETPQ